MFIFTFHWDPCHIFLWTLTFGESRENPEELEVTVWQIQKQLPPQRLNSIPPRVPGLSISASFSRFNTLPISSALMGMTVMLSNGSVNISPHVNHLDHQMINWESLANFSFLWEMKHQIHRTDFGNNLSYAFIYSRYWDLMVCSNVPDWTNPCSYNICWIICGPTGYAE